MSDLQPPRRRVGSGSAPTSEKLRRSQSKEAPPKDFVTTEPAAGNRTPKRRRNRKHKKQLFPHTFGVRTSYIDNVLIKLKNRPAIDILSSDDTQGLVHLGILVIVSATIQLMASNFIKFGFLVDLRFMLCLMSDGAPAFFIWLMMNAFSFSSYFLQLARVKHIVSESSALILHTIFVVAIVIVPIQLIFMWNLAPVVSGMLSMDSLVLCMKMHSYFSTNTLYASNTDPNVKAGGDDCDSCSDDDSIVYPENVNISNYMFYLCVPSLVYEKEYPRTPTIRYMYAAKEFLQMFGCCMITYVGFAQFLLPIIKEDKHIIFYDLVRLAIPSMTLWLICFYAFFHCFLNGISALLRFADRQFYLDWWNSENLEEFWKKWNLLVHEWMLRHVYYQSIQFGQSKMMASMITFFISAVMHEIVLFVTFKVARPWFFLGMFIQVPLIFISKFLNSKLPKESAKRWGNIFVWCSLFAGQPIIEILYIREWFWSHSDFFCIHTTTPIYGFAPAAELPLL